MRANSPQLVEESCTKPLELKRRIISGFQECASMDLLSKRTFGQICPKVQAVDRPLTMFLQSLWQKSCVCSSETKRAKCSEDYVAQFELKTTANTTDTAEAINEINAIQNGVDEVVVPVSAESRALVDAFDQITEKASEIQSRGIYGDEAMIAAAAEFSTYFSDTDAIEMMMDTLSDYANYIRNLNLGLKFTISEFKTL